MLEHLEHEVGRQRSVDAHGVPVPLVRVLAGRDLRVLSAQDGGPARIALECHRGPIQRCDGEHLAPDLVDQRIGAERRGFGRAGLPTQPIADLIPVHLTKTYTC